MATSSVEKQIDNYLSLLNSSEKKTILNVVKTIDNIWDNESFTEEMESRAKSYENGTAKLYKFEEMKKAAISNYKKATAKK